jgi:hypothetical protein
MPATAGSKQCLIRESECYRIPAREENRKEIACKGKIRKVDGTGGNFAEPNPNPYFGKEGKRKGRENVGNNKIKTRSGTGKQN